MKNISTVNEKNLSFLRCCDGPRSRDGQMVVIVIPASEAGDDSNYDTGLCPLKSNVNVN